MDRRQLVAAAAASLSAFVSQIDWQAVAALVDLVERGHTCPQRRSPGRRGATGRGGERRA